MPEYRTKGTHAIQVAAWVNEQIGAGTYEALMAQVSPSFPKILLPGSWYEVEPLYGVIKLASEKLLRSPEEVTTEIARRNAQADLTGLYRAFLRIASPTALLSFTPRLWSTYVRFGVATALRNEPGDYLAECTEVAEQVLDWACGAWQGFVPAAIELAGGKNPRPLIVKRVRNGEHSLLQCSIRYG